MLLLGNVTFVPMSGGTGEAQLEARAPLDHAASALGCDAGESPGWGMAK